MRAKKNFGILLLLICSMSFVCCDNDESKDKVITVKMFVSAETGMRQPWGASQPVECMLVKEEHEKEYSTLGFLDITGFKYEKGNEYKLLVKKTILINPPADGSSVTYELIEVLSLNKAISN